MPNSVDRAMGQRADGRRGNPSFFADLFKTGSPSYLWERMGAAMAEIAPESVP
jgi:hypothetical protein